MVTLVLASAFWFILALIFACLEIEAEGKYGWAEKMPTWYRTTGPIPRLYGLLMSGKPLTGYHSFMFFMPILIFHSHFFMGVEWSWTAEIMAWAMYLAWSPLWDYLWFVLNPHYGVSKFRKDAVWWHSKSPWVLGRLPLDYFIGWTISCGLAFVAGQYVAHDLTVFTNHMIMIGLFTMFTVATILVIAPIYQRWYWQMRKRDDRDQAHISHSLPLSQELKADRSDTT